jgi:hypothetical protein
MPLTQHPVRGRLLIVIRLNEDGKRHDQHLSLTILLYLGLHLNRDRRRVVS